ncbi:DinB family protein [Aliifodinibius salicampi]|uniref:DinB family protein n=1 Tax=Fodinibius salicampi TaxID=1920655 RepID=A0ABT3PXH4_9BACT|nr:DinB family protein [Fodinibius salicampi]MCW9712536.1 DinB family protein [Fodinibius salicampi]
MGNRTKQEYDYHQWANNRFFEHLVELPDKVYEKEIQSVFSSVAEVIVHIYQTDGMWLSVMSGDSFEETMSVIDQLKERVADRSLGHMQQLYTELAKEYKTFFDDCGDLSKVISINHPKYGSLETPVADLVKHVVNHGTYHRGNITAMLRQQGQAGVPTDYIFYLYEIA